MECGSELLQLHFIGEGRLHQLLSHGVSVFPRLKFRFGRVQVATVQKRAVTSFTAAVSITYEKIFPCSHHSQQ
jgi:hypothetical protein